MKTLLIFALALLVTTSVFGAGLIVSVSQAGSPAIGAGVYIAGVSTANPPNIGAK